jgi:ankyrin repeat protein
MWAAADFAKVRLLVDKGADVNAKSKQGRTPLIIAARHNGAEAILRLLIAKGADPRTTDASRNTSVIAAVKLLLKAGAQVNGVSAVASVNVKAGPIALGRYTALLLAAPYGSYDLINTLLDAGADVNAKDVRGMTLGLCVPNGPLATAIGSPSRDDDHQFQPHGSERDELSARSDDRRNGMQHSLSATSRW